MTKTCGTKYLLYHPRVRAIVTIWHSLCLPTTEVSSGLRGIVRQRTDSAYLTSARGSTPWTYSVLEAQQPSRRTEATRDGYCSHFKVGTLPGGRPLTAEWPSRR